MKKGDTKKLLDIPPDIVKAYNILAKQERMSTKALMEKVLIDHVQKEPADKNGTQHTISRL